jgi:hypothetical protein
MDPEQIPIRDLHLPEAVGWWPLAPGWWVLVAAAAAGLLYLLFRAYKKWRWNAARRVALREFARVRDEFAAGMDAVTLAIELSELLRRTMLAYAPRNEVASLTGRRWLQWLDRGLDDQPFSNGSGRALESLPYRNREKIADEVDVEGLIDAVSRRLRTPLPGVTA